jgi:DNA-directed RNA polymerase specialized sigma24 family protein
MKDPRLAAALLKSSPDALAELFDAYGDRLFRYCWSMLRSRGMAQVALRDTLLVAQAHIARLADPEDPASLGPWLYSLARAECRRHQAVSPADADESPAWLGLPAADARLMSWNAAMSLAEVEFEALDLACRHYVDLALVLGLPAGEADGLLDRARQNLERALGAQILASRGPACPSRDALLADSGLADSGLAARPGPMTAAARERLLAHADGCATCGPEVPRNVSATRVFALLPVPALTQQDRAEILAVLAGQQPPAAPALAPPVPSAAPALTPPAASAASAGVPAALSAASAGVPAGSAASAGVPAAPSAGALAAAVPAQGRSVLGPSLASYVRAPEPPVRFSVPPVHAPAPPAVGGQVASPGSSAAPAAAASGATEYGGLSAPLTQAAAPSDPATFAALAASSTSSAPVGPSAQAGPSAPAPAAASPSPKRTPRPRRVHRGRLLVAGAGVLVSGVVIASAIAAAGPGTHTAAGRVTPTLAAGAATGPALQSSGLGAAGPASSAAPSGARRAATVLTTPPPLVSTAGSKNQVMITDATQPLPPGAAPGAQPHGTGTSGNQAAAAPGALQLSAGGVVLGGGSTGQITLTATGGTVNWSAAVSGSGPVSLSSYGGTLTAGHSITVVVQVSRGSGAGSAAISFQGKRLGNTGRPGHLVGPAGRFRTVVAPAPVAARSVAFVGLAVRHPGSGPDLVRSRPPASDRTR